MSFILTEFADDIIFIKSFVIISLILGRPKGITKFVSVVVIEARVASTMGKGIW